MPPFPITKDGLKGFRRDPAELNLSYTYPHELDLKPGNETHDQLIQMLNARATMAYSNIAQNFDEWIERDSKLRAYIPADIQEKRRKKEREGDNSPLDVEIVMPVSYAIMQAHLTYLMKAFLSEPTFRYEGVGPDDVVRAKLLQQVIAHQYKRAQMAIPLHAMFRSSIVYGIGSVSPVWYVEKNKRRKLKAQGVTDRALSFFNPKRISSEKTDQVSYEGNKLIAIDPYRYLPDPHVAAHDIQDGEFVGWSNSTNYFNLLSEEQSSNNQVFNVQYLQILADKYSAMTPSQRSQASGKIDRSSVPTAQDVTTKVDAYWLYVKLIPAAWGLGSSEYPEMWLFRVVADRIIIQASRMDLDHGMFPVVTCAPDTDGFTSVPSSRLSIIQPMQIFMDFLYTCRMLNLRKSITGQFVVNPFLVNINDLNNPRPGKLIRLRKQAWGGTPVEHAVKQLEVQDITEGHVGDISYLAELMQQVTGATDQVLGLVKPRTSRISASEVQGARASSLSRLEAMATMISMQAMTPLARMLASQTIQLLDENVYLRLNDETDQEVRDYLGDAVENERASISPLELSIDFDVLESDGTVPGSQDVGTWVELFTIISQNPILTQQFDVARIFQHIAFELGAKNIGQFRVKVGTEEEVQQQADAGNIQPVPEA